MSGDGRRNEEEDEEERFWLREHQLPHRTREFGRSARDDFTQRT